MDLRATFERFHETVNTGDRGRIDAMIDELVAPDAQIRTPLPLDVTGAEALKHVWATLLNAFPDLHVAVEDTIVEADKLVCRNTVTGTHRGAFMGIEATGRPVEYREIFIFRFAGGRVVETWGVVDSLSLLRQLG
jgi:steroid delta-isomerase-like uncharacterized protein